MYKANIQFNKDYIIQTYLYLSHFLINSHYHISQLIFKTKKK